VVYDLKKRLPQFDVMSFPDHHHFTHEDIQAIQTRAAGRTIITTENDATRLYGLENLRVIPIEVEVLYGKREEFNQLIKHFVTTHSRKSVHNNHTH
jgi:tetraacyldisaccharide 4'-kinase